MHLIGVAYSHPLGRGRSAVPPIDNLTDMRYVGSVTVNEANGRFYEPSPGTELYGGGKRELYHLEVYQDALPSSSLEAKCAGRLNQRHLQSTPTSRFISASCEPSGSLFAPYLPLSYSCDRPFRNIRQLRKFHSSIRLSCR